MGSTGLYERAVQWVTEHVKPHLHKITQQFVNKSVDKYAKDNPQYARMIEFEVKRRGNGAGLTQDVAEPVIWIGIKSATAVAIDALSKQIAKHVRNDKTATGVKWGGSIAALTIIAQQAVELFRVIPRYKAGLQGSLEMAKDRWHSIEETGIDPFSSQTREYNTQVQEKGSNFAQNIQSRSIAPDAIIKDKNNNTEMTRI